MVMSTAKPLAELQKGWSEIATNVNMMNPSEVPVVEGLFATAVNDWIAEAKTTLTQFSTAATELGTAAGESVDEELALAGAPTLADIMEKQRDIAKMAENGQDYREDTKELQEMIRKRNEALKNLTTASEGVNSQTESVFIPDIPDPTAPEGGDVPEKPGDDEGLDQEDDDDDDDDGEGADTGEKPEGTQPHDPATDIKLPEVSPKPTSPTPGGETPSATPPSAEPSTRLSSDSPTPSATPTPSAAQTTTSSAVPTSTAAQQPSMPQVSMPQSSPTSSATPQAQQAAAQMPTQQQTLKGLQDKIDAAKEKSEKDEDTKADDASTGDASGDVAGGAAVLGTTAPVAHAVPAGSPTNLSSSPTVTGTPAAPHGAPTPPPGGAVGGAPMGGAGAMGSGNAAQQKNAAIISSQQPEPPLPAAPSVPGSKQSPNFNWNDDAVLPSNPPDQDKR